MRTTTSAGITYLKDKNSYPADEANEFNRLEYGDITHGSTQFIATLDDGLSFQGDSDKKAPVKLNQTLSVTGGVTNSDNLASANNIGVVSTPAGEDAQGNITENTKLQLKLAKDVNLGTDGSITMKSKNGENTLTMKRGDHKVGVDGQDGSTRMVYHEGTKEGGVDHQVATLDDSKDTLNVKLAKDLKGLDSVETKTVNTNTINIAKDDNHNAICRCQLQARPGQPCLHVARGHGQGN